MTFPNFAANARNLHGIKSALVVALLLLISVVVGYIAASVSASSSHFAAWWPAAGVNVIAALAVGRKHRLLVLGLVALTTFPVSLSTDHPLQVAIVGSLAVAVEAWIVTRFSVDRNDQPRLTTTRDVTRFLLGAAIGSLVMGLAAAAISGSTEPTAFLVVGASVMASHGSAIIVIAPIALVNRLKVPLGKPHIRALHATLLAGSIFLAFSPGSFPPLAFLPVPFLAWAAFSFSMSVSLMELIGASSLIVILTAVGGGPFNELGGIPFQESAMLEFYVITLSVTTLLIAAARNERQILEERNIATARLLHEGFEQAQSGFAIIRESEGYFRVQEANTAASILLPSSLARSASGNTEVVVGSGLYHLLLKMTTEGMEEASVSGDDELPVQVSISNVEHSTFGRILLVSIIDLRPIRAAQEAVKTQLAREQAVVEELRALNQQKDDFVSSVSHELRTPITTVIGFSEELEFTPLDETQKNYVAIIQRNAERLLSVVEDVLTFSRRIPGLPSAPGAENADVILAITMVLDDVRHSLRDKRIAVSTDFPEEAIRVRAQDNDVTRVIVNLVTNAVKFTPPDGTLEIVASVTATDVVITITDSGPGIAPSDIDKVFDRFYRSSRAAHDGVPGTGLGLSIVKDLVDDMHGTIALLSDGVHGTTARIVLPLADTNVPATPTV